MILRREMTSKAGKPLVINTRGKKKAGNWEQTRWKRKITDKEETAKRE